MNRKTWIVLGIIALFAGVVGASALQNYLSPEIEVTIEAYALTLAVNATTCAKGDPLKFSGNFTTESYIIIGQNITLWCNTTYTGFWDLTDTYGYYEIMYPASTVGVSTFYTNTTVTET